MKKKCIFEIIFNTNKEVSRCLILTLPHRLILLTDGVFGAYMQVNIQNDGPVTISLESPVLSEVRPLGK